MMLGALACGRIIIPALLIGFTAVSVASAQQSPPLDACTKADSAPSVTIAACTAALANPELTGVPRVTVLLARGLAQYRIGQLVAATNDFDAVLQIDPNSKLAHLDRGYVEYAAGDYRNALADHTVGAEIEPRDDDASLVAMGRDQTMLGATPSAIDNFDLVLRRNPNDEAAYVGRGYAFLDEHIAFAAMRDFVYASTLDPSDAEADAGAAQAEAAQGSFDAAIKSYTTALQLDPQSADALNGRGIARLNAGDHTGAIADFAKASDLAPHWSTPLFNAGLAYFDTGSYPIAYEQFDLALAANPNSVQSVLWAHITSVDMVSVNDQRAFAAHRAKLDPSIANLHPWADLLALFSGKATVDHVLTADVLLGWEPALRFYTSRDEPATQCTTLALAAEWQLAHAQRAAALGTFERAASVCDGTLATNAIVVFALRRLNGSH